MIKQHPYQGAPDYQIWKKEPAIADARLFDPVTHVKFSISERDAVVTAGSCFAQHVARHLIKRGFNFLVTERPARIIAEATSAANHYGLFSARYGNIYTARQLRQLLERSFGQFNPVTSSWFDRNGKFIDPYRPQIQQGGYISERELSLDRQNHLAAVREAIMEMDVFVFTLGLTESWEDSRDGAVFPMAPGVVGGTFDPDIHVFRNFSIGEIVDDMNYSIEFIRSHNPNCRFIFTVSPIALNATAVDRHVFVSTTYSKSVLRIAAERITDGRDFCDYFPSYEIITSPYMRGQYFGPDCREVTEQGVGHVMGVFLKHYGSVEVNPSFVRDEPSSGNSGDLNEVFVNALCDEEMVTNAIDGRF